MEAQPLASKAVEITMRDGYKAALTIDWFASRDVAVTDVSADCMAQAGLADQDPLTYHLVEIPVRLRVDYPSVNGLVWPADHDIQFAVTTGGVGPTGDMATCGFPANPGGAAILMPDPTAGGMVEGSIVYFAKKTPNDPNGTVVAPLGETMLSTTGLYSQSYSCVGEPNEYCRFYYPG